MWLFLIYCIANCGDYPNTQANPWKATVLRTLVNCEKAAQGIAAVESYRSGVDVRWRCVDISNLVKPSEPWK